MGGMRKSPVACWRPIGVYMHVFEGLNMRTVFVERAEVAQRIS